MMGSLPDRLPTNLFRYVFAVSWRHQIALVALTVITFLLEIVPLEIQRRVVNNLVKERPFQLVIVLCAAYACAVLIQGATKLGLNIYRGWVGENATRDLRRHVIGYSRTAQAVEPGAEARGIGAAMIVAEVEPIGGFVGSSLSEPLLQGGIMLSILAYIVHLDRWMAAAAFALFLPQLVFVPLMQGGINRRAGARVWVLRQLGISTIESRIASADQDRSDAKRIDCVLQLDMAIFKLKFSMNFLMNFCNHLQVVAALLIGGWMVHTDQLQVGGVVAFISAVGRLNDPWGDLVNYFRDLSVTQVKFDLVAEKVNGRTAFAATFEVRKMLAFWYERPSRAAPITAAGSRSPILNRSKRGDRGRPSRQEHSLQRRTGQRVRARRGSHP
jgi:ABC-type multidrug transport system fused ATPase/permease subunit